ncbi:hypothetical protein BV25DRAFT_405897 [Artomyces pyxidatus]|uniref:Uncharacterized protein n=1 Tax=Artomyces pyxidatus TaxID=48021 RepID=A0ACB8T6D3_9AGAM|nr:hypothetical protein BV25DRAFT_405897 [Artomyces pyxidatus]
MHLMMVHPGQIYVAWLLRLPSCWHAITYRVLGLLHGVQLRLSIYLLCWRACLSCCFVTSPSARSVATDLLDIWTAAGIIDNMRSTMIYPSVGLDISC